MLKMNNQTSMAFQFLTEKVINEKGEEEDKPINIKAKKMEVEKLHRALDKEHFKFDILKGRVAKIERMLKMKKEDKKLVAKKKEPTLLETNYNPDAVKEMMNELDKKM